MLENTKMINISNQRIRLTAINSYGISEESIYLYDKSFVANSKPINSDYERHIFQVLNISVNTNDNKSITYKYYDDPQVREYMEKLENVGTKDELRYICSQYRGNYEEIIDEIIKKPLKGYGLEDKATKTRKYEVIRNHWYPFVKHYLIDIYGSEMVFIIGESRLMDINIGRYIESIDALVSILDEYFL